MLPNTEILESMAKSGFDFVGLDMQHGAMDFRAIVQGIQLLDVLGVPMFVRLSRMELAMIPRFLDFGAGVIVAMVEDSETVREAVSASRYQPDGSRSYGGQRYGLRAEPADPRDIRPPVFAMIETLHGLERLNEIARVPGLAGLFVGPVDLALAMGASASLLSRVTGAYVRRSGDEASGDVFADDQPLKGERDRWLAAISEVVRVAHAEGISTGMFAVDGADAARWAQAGFDMVVISSDIGLLRAALTRELDVARARKP